MYCDYDGHAFLAPEYCADQLTLWRERYQDIKTAITELEDHARYCQNKANSFRALEGQSFHEVRRLTAAAVKAQQEIEETLRVGGSAGEAEGISSEIKTT